jgi:hypothetical protein
VTAKGVVQVATFVVTLGLVLATVAVWVLVKRRTKRHAQGNPLDEHDAVASILNTPGLTPDEKRKLRRHLAKSLDEESTKDPKNLKKPIDLEDILRK